MSAQEAVANAQWYVRQVPTMTDEPRKIAEAAEALRAAIAALSADCQLQDGDYLRTGREPTECPLGNQACQDVGIGRYERGIC